MDAASSAASDSSILRGAPAPAPRRGEAKASELGSTTTASPEPDRRKPRRQSAVRPVPPRFPPPRPSQAPQATLGFLCHPRHEAAVLYGGRKDPDAGGNAASGPASAWRLRPRMRTACGGIIMCLNVGTDPPDVVKPQPCARMECWYDPSRVQRKKATDEIGVRVLEQFESLAKAKYKQVMDPTVDEVHRLCGNLRKVARSDRVLLHYNGHGVPRPTESGEVWVFNKSFTQYIPLAVDDIVQWVGRPTIFVLDCSGAGALLPYFDAAPETTPSPPSPPVDAADDCIVLAPCGAGELLPMGPAHPADLFTACLTTPMRCALRRFVQTNQMSMPGITEAFVDAIPGRYNDRKTPLGELNWIFTAITDTIAWNTLPRALFQRLFRQDLLLAALFRNFLFANRVLRGLGLAPMSRPTLPDTSEHPLWATWDLAVENCLFQLAQRVPPASVPNDLPSVRGRSFDYPSPAHGGGGQSSGLADPLTSPTARTLALAEIRLPPSSVFAEQLTAFEVWLRFGRGCGAQPPEQLPMVLQVLLSQAHRHRALLLLRQFLELGPWAVHLALSVGIFPYVLKLLKSPAPELCPVLVAIWARILCYDKSCQFDLVKPPDAHPLKYFLAQLRWPPAPAGETGANPLVLQLPSAGELRARLGAAFSLAQIMDGHRSGQELCMRNYLHVVASDTLHALSVVAHASGAPQSPSANLRLNPNLHPAIRAPSTPTRPPPQHPSAQLRAWLCLCIGRLCHEHPRSQVICLHTNTQTKLSSALYAPEVGVRAAAVTALAAFFSFDRADASPGQSEIQGILDPHSTTRFKQMQLSIGLNLILVLSDGSPLVRREALLGLTDLLFHPLHVFGFLHVVRAILPCEALRSGRGNPASEAPQPSPSAASLAARFGEDAPSYQKIWRAIQGARGREPFPAVARVIRDLTGVINKALLENDRPPTRRSPPPETSPPPNNAAINRSLTDGGRLQQAPPMARHSSQHRLPRFDEAPVPDQDPLDRAARLLVGFRHENRDAFFQWLQWRFKHAQPEQPQPSADSAPDPLSVGGVLTLYLRRRNRQTWEAAENLRRQFQNGAVAEEGPERVRFDQCASLSSDCDMTSLLLFHPYETALVSADDTSRLHLWQYEQGRRLLDLRNGNPGGTRMTCLAWLNPEAKSLLLVGSDDGVVRVWDGLLDAQALAPEGDDMDGEVPAAGPLGSPGSGGVADAGSGPRLVTAFRAMPMGEGTATEGFSSSGLVAEWRQDAGMLILGGSSDKLRLWDLEQEQNVATWQSGAEAACVTSLASVGWDSVLDPARNPSGGAGGSGFALVAGFGNGALRVFDTRVEPSANPCLSMVEHQHWVVHVQFTSNSSCQELLSGSLAGEVKLWDLRYTGRGSTRTIEVQRSPMTALALHPCAPIIASGSHKQFIKILNGDGDQLSMIKHHNNFMGQRVGPVSSLVFHPHKLLLAGGATDNIISVYSTDA